MVDSIDNYPIFIPDTLPLPLCTLLNIKLYLRDLDLKIKPLLSGRKELTGGGDLSGPLEFDLSALTGLICNHLSMNEFIPSP